MESLRIGVVGAGTAGAAAAILLARAGHAVTLFERVATPGPVGAGITLQPTGQAVLARLGLLEPIVARATRLDGLLCRRPDGRAVVDLRYADVDPSLHGYGLHRGVLFEALFAAARAEPRVALHCGVAIASTALEAGARWLVAADATRHGPFELVVVADGSISGIGASCAARSRSRSCAGSRCDRLLDRMTHRSAVPSTRRSPGLAIASAGWSRPRLSGYRPKLGQGVRRPAIPDKRARDLAALRWRGACLGARACHRPEHARPG